MKEIVLTQGKVALVDDEDYADINQYKWFAHFSKNAGLWYAERNIPSGNKKRKPLGMHRQITNAPSDCEVDHKDRDGLNNKRSNLRVCIRTLNQGNTKLRSDSTSGVKGVSLKRGFWHARIQYKKKRIHLGKFPSLEHAAMAYNAAAVKYFGEYARVNSL